MARNIVVLCDGTWNSADMKNRTAIKDLDDHVLAHTDDQLVAYFPGIGVTDDFDRGLGRWVVKYGGGAFGWGLESKVKEAYRFVAANYRDGDRIHLFGFSRGAYTVRSVAGMIRKCGIAEDTSVAGIDAAFDLYRTPGRRNAPDEPHVIEARRRISPRFATSGREQAARGDGAALVRTAYLGVFDTVGAKGIPRALFGPLALLWNQKYEFHDTELSSSVVAARHAIAADERRTLYPPALWRNLPRLNGAAQGDDAPYRQAWFVGTHGIVGGSSKPDALGAIPAAWVLAGAPDLAVRDDYAAPEGDPLAASADLKGDGGLLKAWRAGPITGDAVDPSVEARVRARRDYRPGSLAAWLPAWLGTQ